MTYSPCQCKNLLRSLAHELGIGAIGVTDALPVDAEASVAYRQWLSRGDNADMAYAQRYLDVRDDPRQLLCDARSIIVCAFPYAHSCDPATARLIASYAHGDDYHEVVRQRLQLIVDALSSRYGGQYRIVVDTAPLRERYFAQRAGLGIIGRNGLLIVDSLGSRCFIGSIITTLDIPADTPAKGSCLGCGRCIAACPGHAISPATGCVDARRCLSYLTIEHRGDFPPDLDLHGHLYGCDICQDVCPHNASLPQTPIQQFNLRPALANLTPQAVLQMTQADFSAIFSHSAIKRAKLAGLQRNARQLLANNSNLL